MDKFHACGQDEVRAIKNLQSVPGATGDVHMTSLIKRRIL